MSELVGEWNGEFTNGATTLRIAIRFYVENQELNGMVTNKAVATSGEAADVSLCSTNKFHFFGSRINGEYFVYNARLVNGALVGTYKVGKTCIRDNPASFMLTKVTRGQ